DRSDLVDLAGALADRLGADRGEAEADQFLRFRVQVAFRLRPGEAQAAHRLLGQVVGAPGAQCEQAEDGICGCGQTGGHPLTLLQSAVVSTTPDWSSLGGWH